MSEEYKCDICGAPATVHLTQIVDGKIHKAHLCANCAAKSKVAELPILKFTEMLAKTLASGGKKAAQEISETDAAGREPGKICPVCGMTDVVFEKKHLFGCAHCYEVFSDEVAALLPKIQRGRDYRSDSAKKPSAGKKESAPGVPAGEKSASADPAALRRRLKTAVEQEDYALAARLRDELRAAEKKSAAPASGKKTARARVPAKKNPPKKRVPAPDGKKSSGGKKS